MKYVFISGSSRGIGRATVNVFAENGWNIIAHARKKSNKLENDLFEIAQKCNVTITPVYFDMLDTETMKECIKALKKERIVIDALVNNAGVSHGGLFQMTSVSAIKDIFNVNLFAHMELTQIVLKIMAKENASIVNVASIAGIDIRAGNSAYGVSKAALIAWTKVLQMEMQNKVRVNAVAPGLTDTDMAYEMESKQHAITLNQAINRRLAKPAEIADAIYFLSSDKASFITGEVLVIDGGGI